MNKQLSLILSIVTIILVAAGVWWFTNQESTDNDVQSQQEIERSSAEESEEAEASAQTVGTVTVDGTSYNINETILCEPLEDEQLAMIERELELQGFGTHDGERVQIDVYIESISGTPSNSVSWSGPEGVFGMGEAESADVLQADGRVSGSTVLVDARTFSESIDISFDLSVPSEKFNCR